MRSHFDNTGPRTTNVVEGWNSSLNSHFGTPHPSLRVFLDWLQKCQYQVQIRGIQLAAGRSPKQRRATYVQLDADLWNVKVSYRPNMEISNIFFHASPSTWDWSMWQFRVATEHFLRRSSYLLGCCCCLYLSGAYRPRLGLERR